MLQNIYNAKANPTTELFDPLLCTTLIVCNMHIAYLSTSYLAPFFEPCYLESSTFALTILKFLLLIEKDITSYRWPWLYTVLYMIRGVVLLSSCFLTGFLQMKEYEKQLLPIKISFLKCYGNIKVWEINPKGFLLIVGGSD